MDDDGCPCGESMRSGKADRDGDARTAPAAQAPRLRELQVSTTPEVGSPTWWLDRLGVLDTRIDQMPDPLLARHEARKPQGERYGRVY